MSRALGERIARVVLAAVQWRHDRGTWESLTSAVDSMQPGDHAVVRAVVADGAVSIEASLVLKYSAAIEALEALKDEPNDAYRRQVLFLGGFLRAALNHYATSGAKS